MPKLAGAHTRLEVREEDRTRIVRLCVTLTGDPDAAEDLAQETLIEAWRHAHALREPEKRSAWLSGIARNVCRRWARTRGREIARLLPPGDASRRGQAPSPQEHPDAGFDVTEELERGELAVLLDRALDLLPPETRAVLIARLVEERPQREVAQGLGVSEAAVAVRLQRGKLSLRHVLTTRMPAEAASYGLLDDADGWRETRIWCFRCGNTRLRGRWGETRAQLYFTCPGCAAASGADLTYSEGGDLFATVKGFKPALSRLLRSTDADRRRAVQSPHPPCGGCGRPMRRMPLTSRSGLAAACPACGSSYETDLAALAMALPESLRFWREHPRTRVLHTGRIEARGRAAHAVSLTDVTGAARLDVLLAADDFVVLGIHPNEHV